MKKLCSLILVLVMLFSCCLLAVSCNNNTGDEGKTPEETDNVVKVDPSTIKGDVKAIKIGAVLVGDENEGYTYAHMLGIRNAAKAIGIDEATQILWKYSIGEDDSCKEACIDLVNQGCDVIFTNSYGHQSFALEVAKANPDVAFVAMTGDTAKAANLDNFSNAFTRVYESRYVSGVVAGLKLKELIDKGELTTEKHPENFDKDGNIKIGYVGAFPYAEVVSGYTAFYLGIKSIVSNVVMDVRYTNSWFDITAEGTACEALIADGCIIIGQHADSTGAPAAAQAAHEDGELVFSIGYNVSMLNVAPDVALTSASNNWDRYYAYALVQIINGEKIATNWSEGYDTGAVACTALNDKIVAEGTADKVAAVIADIKSGKIKVFDTANFTVSAECTDGSYATDENGKVTHAFATDTNGDFVNDADEAIIDGYYHESHFQSAPSFVLRIDGITEK